MLGDAFVYVDPKGNVLTKAKVLMHSETTDALQFGRSHDCEAARKDCDRHRTLPDEGYGAGKPFVRRGRFVDTWLDKNGQWIAIASLLTPAGN